MLSDSLIFRSDFRVPTGVGIPGMYGNSKFRISRPLKVREYHQFCLGPWKVLSFSMCNNLHTKWIFVDVISLHFHKILFLITFIKNCILSCHIIFQQAGQLLFNTYIPCKRSVKVLKFSWKVLIKVLESPYFWKPK